MSHSTLLGDSMRKRYLGLVLGMKEKARFKRKWGSDQAKESNFRISKPLKCRCPPFPKDREFLLISVLFKHNSVVRAGPTLHCISSFLTKGLFSSDKLSKIQTVRTVLEFEFCIYQLISHKTGFRQVCIVRMSKYTKYSNITLKVYFINLWHGWKDDVSNLHVWIVKQCYPLSLSSYSHLFIQKEEELLTTGSMIKWGNQDGTGDDLLKDREITDLERGGLRKCGVDPNNTGRCNECREKWPTHVHLDSFQHSG